MKKSKFFLSLLLAVFVAATTTPIATAASVMLTAALFPL